MRASTVGQRLRRGEGADGRWELLARYKRRSSAGRLRARVLLARGRLSCGLRNGVRRDSWWSERVAVAVPAGGRRDGRWLLSFVRPLSARVSTRPFLTYSGHRGFACANINGQTCIRIVSSTTLPTMSCRGNSAVFATMTLPDSGARVTSLSVYAPLIQLNFQSSDLTPTQTTIQNPSGDEQLTLAPGAPQSTGLGIGGRPTPTNTNGSPGSNSGSGFSVGAMVGVGVAGGLAFLAALVGGCWVWQRRLRQRRDRKDAAMQKLDNLYEASRPTALGGDGYSRYEVKPLPARPLGVDEYTMHSPVSPNTYVPTGRQYRPYRPSGF